MVGELGGRGGGFRGGTHPLLRVAAPLAAALQLPAHPRLASAVHVRGQRRQVAVRDGRPRGRGAPRLVQREQQLVVRLVKVAVHERQAQVEQVQRRGALAQRRNQEAVRGCGLGAQGMGWGGAS